MRPGEENGKEYNFITREQMEEDIQAGKFIEFGEYKGNLYGTSSESVTAIVNSGKVCILNPHYQALKMLRTPQLKPYIIYIKPPSLDVLKETRNAFRARSTFDVNNSRGFTVSFDLRKLQHYLFINMDLICLSLYKPFEHNVNYYKCYNVFL